MLNRIARFIKKVRSRKGYTLIEAATVVAITGAMAIIAVPIASDKIEDSKIAIAGLTTKAISTAMVKFFGDTGYFPIAARGGGGTNTGEGTGNTSFANGAIVRSAGERLEILRSGLKVDGTVETDNTLDPELADTNDHEDLWTGALTLTKAATKANAGTDTTGTSTTSNIVRTGFHNLNSHLVTDSPGYSAKGSLNWFGPYIPSVDQDPWGRNYLAYVRALDTMSLGEIGTVAQGGTSEQEQVFVPQVNPGTVNNRIFAWVISSGPDEKLQTAPTDSILRGDDIGTIISIPPILLGQNDAKKNK